MSSSGATDVPRSGTSTRIGTRRDVPPVYSRATHRDVARLTNPLPCSDRPPTLFVTTRGGLTEQLGRVPSRLSASREKLEKTVESRQNRAAPEQCQHFEDARAVRAAGHG